MKYFVFFALLLLPTFASAQSVDILYRGETQTPPFYQGGSWWTGESTLELYAVPQDLGNPASLNYKWRRGTEVLGDLSGVGKDHLTFGDTIFSRPQTFSVQILDNQENVLAQSFITVTPTAPSLLVYEHDPLYGILFNREVSDSYPLRGQEATFATFPLFFSPSTLSYAWKSNAGTDSTGSEVTYRIPDGASGQASVSVSVANPSTIRQTATRSFLLQFGNNAQ